MMGRPIQYWFFAVFLAITAQCIATTVRSVSVICPICESNFVGHVVGSTSTFGERARDLSDDTAFIFNQIQTCPYCLYSALQADFDKLSPEQKAQIRRTLDHLPDLLKKYPLKWTECTDDWTRQDVLEILIAAECNRQRPKTPQDEVFFWRAAARHRALFGSMYLLQRTVEALKVALESRDIQPETHLCMTYLLAEFQRQSGQNDSARENFLRAKSLATQVGSDTAVFVSFCDEQLFRMKMNSAPDDDLQPHLNVHIATRADLDRAPMEYRVALDLLMKRRSTRAWQILFEFVKDQPGNFVLMCNMNRPTFGQLLIHPPLFEWAQQQYHKRPLSSPSEDGPVHISDLLSERLMDLFDPAEGFLSNDMDRAHLLGEQLESALQNTHSSEPPDGWTLRGTLNIIAGPVREGRPNAIRWLYKYAQEADYPLEHEYYWNDILKAVAAHKNARDATKQLQPGGQRSNQIAVHCLRFVSGDTTSKAWLTNLLEKSKQWEGAFSLITESFTINGDSSLKKVILNMWSNQMRETTRFDWAAGSYLNAIKAYSSVSILKAIARTRGDNRDEVESTITSLQLSELAERITPTTRPTLP